MGLFGSATPGAGSPRPRDIAGLSRSVGIPDVPDSHGPADTERHGPVDVERLRTAVSGHPHAPFGRRVRVTDVRRGMVPASGPGGGAPPRRAASVRHSRSGQEPARSTPTAVRACRNAHRADAAAVASPSLRRPPEPTCWIQAPAPGSVSICCGSPQAISSTPALARASDSAEAAASAGPPLTATTTTGRDPARPAMVTSV